MVNKIVYFTLKLSNSLQGLSSLSQTEACIYSTLPAWSVSCWWSGCPDSSRTLRWRLPREWCTARSQSHQRTEKETQTIVRHKSWSLSWLWWQAISQVSRFNERFWNVLNLLIYFMPSLLRLPCKERKIRKRKTENNHFLYLDLYPCERNLNFFETAD